MANLGEPVGSPLEGTPLAWSGTTRRGRSRAWSMREIRPSVTAVTRRQGCPAEEIADDLGIGRAQVAGQPRDSRRVKQGDGRDALAELLLEQVRHDGHLDRAAAKLEEVVVDADLVPAQDLLPELDQELLQGCPGRLGRSAARSRQGAGRGQGRAVNLRRRGSGQRWERHEGVGHHVAGQPCAEVL